MPLIKSASKEALKENIGKEIGAGKDPKQAAAIAYSVQRKASSDCDVATLTKLHGALTKLVSMRKGAAMDAEIKDPKEWITVNGAAIPVGKGGELGGAAGAAIQKSESGGGSSGSSGVHKDIKELKSKVKSANITPAARKDISGLVSKAEGHAKVVAAYEAGDPKKALELAHKVGATKEDYSGNGMKNHKEDAERLHKKASGLLEHFTKVGK